MHFVTVDQVMEEDFVQWGKYDPNCCLVTTIPSSIMPMLITIIIPYSHQQL
jgi:hypothetical protein